jgi:hypothetical protein
MLNNQPQALKDLRRSCRIRYFDRQVTIRSKDRNYDNVKFMRKGKFACVMSSLAMISRRRGVCKARPDQEET